MKTEPPAGPPVQRAARPALALLAVYAGASLWASAVDVRELMLVRDAMAGAQLSDAALNEAMERQQLTSWVFLAVLVITGIAFLRWVHVANKSLRQLGEHLEYGPGETVRGFLIPILNLFRPYQAMANLWRMSAPGQDPARADAPVPAFFNAWWLTWLGSTIVARMAGSAYTKAESLEDWSAALNIFLVSGVIDLVCTALAMTLVSQLSRRIDDRWIAAGESVPLPVART